MSKRKPSSAQLAAFFDRLRSENTRLFFAFGVQLPPIQQIQFLRRRATIFGRQLIRFLPEHRRNIEPNEIFHVYAYDQFDRKLHQIQEECFWILDDSRSMEPEARAKLYGRRLGNRGRKLLMLSALELFDRDALSRIFERERRHDEERARYLEASQGPAPPRVVEIDEAQTRLAEKDRSRSRFILNVGSDRVVFDCTAKMEKRVPPSLTETGRVLPMIAPGTPRK